MSKTTSPDLCYVFIRSAEPGKRIGIIKRGEIGYYLADFDSEDAPAEIAQKAVDHMNDRLDVTPEQALAMEIGSMFGWDVPGAQVSEPNPYRRKEIAW